MSTSLRRLAPAFAALAVLVLVLGIVLALRSTGGDGLPGAVGSSSGDPEPLALADHPHPRSGAEVEPRWHLAGDLPAGTPRDVTLQWVDGVDRDAARRLAAALGLTGDGRTEGSATVWSSGDATLRVEADGAWQYGGSGCQPVVVTGGDDSASSSDSVRCGQPQNPGQPSGSGTPADIAVAFRVLDAAGVAGHPVVRPVRGSSTATVVVEPTVAGLGTGGMATVLRVTGRQVTDGSGWLPTTREGAAYPVVGARTAWQQLRHTLLPQTLIACTVPDAPGTDPLLCGGPVVVTGASLGRSVAHLADGRTALVPAWLFAVSGRDQAYPVVALPERLLRGSGGSGGSGGVITGGPVPSAPVSAVPSGPHGTVAPPTSTTLPTPRRGPGKDPVSLEPANPGSRFSGVRTSGPGTLSVSFTGGVASCYDYRVVVEDTPERLRLSLKQTVTSDRVCIDLAQVYRRTVPLPSPIAGRPVVDAESGAVLLPGPGG